MTDKTALTTATAGVNLSLRSFKCLMSCITRVNQVFHHGACVNCRISIDVREVRIKSSYSFNFRNDMLKFLALNWKKGFKFL